jgi:hypothetical protein
MLTGAYPPPVMAPHPCDGQRSPRVIGVSIKDDEIPDHNGTSHTLYSTLQKHAFSRN